MTNIELREAVNMAIAIRAEFENSNTGYRTYINKNNNYFAVIYKFLQDYAKDTGIILEAKGKLIIME